MVPHADCRGGLHSGFQLLMDLTPPTCGQVAYKLPQCILHKAALSSEQHQVMHAFDPYGPRLLTAVLCAALLLCAAVLCVLCVCCCCCVLCCAVLTAVLSC